MHGSGRRYCPPEVLDYGDLATITAAGHALLGVATSPDLSFSSAAAPTAGGSLGAGTSGKGGGHGGLDALAGGPGAGVGGTADAAPVGGGPTGGSSGGGGSGGHGGGGGGELPFTGLAAGALAAVGSALAVAGGALRRRVRRRAEHY
jgi:hypothetical protein